MSSPSPLELMKSLLEQHGPADLQTLAPAGVVVGAPTPEAQALGVVSVTEAGILSPEPFTPTIHVNISIRAITKSYLRSDRLIWPIIHALKGRDRRIVFSPSTGHEYLIHWTNVTSGPASAVAEARDAIALQIFVDTMIGTEEVSYA